MIFILKNSHAPFHLRSGDKAEVSCLKQNKFTINAFIVITRYVSIQLDGCFLSPCNQFSWDNWWRHLVMTSGDNHYRCPLVVQSVFYKAGCNCLGDLGRGGGNPVKSCCYNTVYNNVYFVYHHI